MNTEELFQRFMSVASLAEKNGKSKVVILGTLDLVKHALCSTVIKVEPASPIVPVMGSLPPHD